MGGKCREEGVGRDTGAGGWTRPRNRSVDSLSRRMRVSCPDSIARKGRGAGRRVGRVSHSARKSLVPTAGGRSHPRSHTLQAAAARRVRRAAGRRSGWPRPPPRPWLGRAR